MSVFRSYFKKNNTLIENNLTNNSQNPVTEISYGTFNRQPTRFIFEVELEDLVQRIRDGLIVPNDSMRHVLHMTNTISYAPQYLGRKSYSVNIRNRFKSQASHILVSNYGNETLKRKPILEEEFVSYG